MARSRDFVFTTNNWTQDHIDLLSTIDCVYVVYGKETGESGTPHLQGYIRFKNQKTMSTVIKMMPGSHIEIKKGTPQQAIDYCKKDGDFIERGEAPKTQQDKGTAGGDAQKRRYEEAFQAAQDGRMEDIPADLLTRHYATYKKIRMDYATKPLALAELCNQWVYGPTGTGKTREAHEAHPDAFIKKANTKWWDGYQGQDTVIIDDFDKYHVALGYELKIWADHNPFPAEMKGSTVMIRPKKIIVTSNYHPSDIWQDEQTLEPIQRRFEIIHKGPYPSAFHPSFNVDN